MKGIAINNDVVREAEANATGGPSQIRAGGLGTNAGGAAASGDQPVLPVPHPSAFGLVLQRFKNKEADASHVTPNEIKAATTDTLTEWLARKLAPPADNWEDAATGVDLVPNQQDQKLIETELAARQSVAKQQAAAAAEAKLAQDRLTALGVSQNELTLIKQTTNNDGIIKACATTCLTKQWNLADTLTTLNTDAKQDGRLAAIEVMAHGQVTERDWVLTLGREWSDLQSYQTINATSLAGLLKSGACKVEGGEYRKHAVKGTPDFAYKFYTNAVPKRRIDPEYHFHLNAMGSAVENPRFKAHDDAKESGGRQLTLAEVNALKPYCPMK